MRAAFAGTPEFARVALERLHAAGFDVPLVLAQPDRPAGRGLKLQPSPVKQFALAHGLDIAQPQGLRLDGRYAQDAQAARETLLQARPDVLVVAAYGLVLPAWALELPRLGCLNIHASVLPRWRGAAPIHRAIEAGDADTGVTIMQMDAGLDTGDMLLSERVAIGPQDTTGTLHDKLAALGARMAVEALELAACGGLRATRQPAEGVTYASKIDKAESSVDWSLPAARIERKLRAFDPLPGCSTTLAGETVKLWRGVVLPAQAGVAAGEIVAVAPAGIDVACGQGVLRLTQLQRAGGKRLAAADFLRGAPMRPGQRLGAA